MSVGATLLKQRIDSDANPKMTEREERWGVKPIVMSNVKKRKTKIRVKGRHLFLLVFISLLVMAQLIVARAKINDLHYEIQVLNYQISKVEAERDANYQHQAELLKLSRLKEVAIAEGAVLDSSKVFRLPDKPMS